MQCANNIILGLLLKCYYQLLNENVQKNLFKKLKWNCSVNDEYKIDEKAYDSNDGYYRY